MTVTICIGNSDNRLDQKEWSRFVKLTELEISFIVEKMYFYGGPPNNAIKQNYAWIVDCPKNKLQSLREELIKIRKTFGQDCIAWVVGETELI